MNCLYVDASRQDLSLGLLIEDRWLSREVINGRHAEVMLPTLVELCEEGGVLIGVISNVVVVNGPGSFTGLRVSVSAIHALDAVKKLNCLPIDQLSAIAQANNWFGPTVIDARMNEAYIGTKRSESGIYETLGLISKEALPETRYLSHEDERELFPIAACYGSYSLNDVRSLAEQQPRNAWIPACQLTPTYVRNTVSWKPLAEQPSKLYDF